MRPLFHLMPTQSGRRACLLWARRTASRGPAENSPASVCSLTLLFKTSSADSLLALRLEWRGKRWRCVAPVSDCCQMPSTLHEMKGVPRKTQGDCRLGLGGAATTRCDRAWRTRCVARPSKTPAPHPSCHLARECASISRFTHGSTAPPESRGTHSFSFLFYEKLIRLQALWREGGRVVAPP